MEKQISTVAVNTPLKAMPVPGVERIEGFTTTMYAMVKKVVIPAIASVRIPGFGSAWEDIFNRTDTVSWSLRSLPANVVPGVQKEATDFADRQ